MLPMHRLLALTITLLAACGEADAPPADRSAAGTLTDSAVVVLDSAQQATSGVVVGSIGGLPADTIKLTGTLSFDPSRISHVGPRIQGRIRAVRVAIGALVAAGDTLGLLDSPELGAAQATWAKAATSREVAARNLERAERLAVDGIVSERRRLEAEAELRERDADLAAAAQALAAFGAEPDSSAPGVFSLRTPIGGEVVDQHAVIGEVVGPESELFTVGELSRLWLILDLYETDIGRVHRDASVHVRVDAQPALDIVGRISHVGAVVDSVSRSVKVRVEVENPGRLLKPGMFVQASLVLPSPANRVGLPGTAVQRLGDTTVAFVPDGAGRYRAVPVRLGREQAGGWREVLQGLASGDRVVLEGSFALKAHLQREQFGGDE